MQLIFIGETNSLEVAKNDKIIDPTNYNPHDKDISGSDADIAIQRGGKILGVIRNISIIISVLVLMVIGIKYMLGSVEEKANYKATMLPYIVGVFMIVSGTSLISLIYDLVTK